MLPVLQCAFPFVGSGRYRWFCYGVCPAKGQAVGPSGGGRFFPVYYVPCLGTPLGDAAQVVPASGESSMSVASSSLWGYLWSLRHFGGGMGQCKPVEEGRCPQ